MCVEGGDVKTHLPTDCQSQYEHTYLILDLLFDMYLFWWQEQNEGFRTKVQLKFLIVRPLVNMVTHTSKYWSCKILLI